MADKASIIKEAQKYLSRGQLDKAIAEWEKLTKEYPDASTFNTLGDLHLKNGNKAKAIESYHQAANFFQQEGFALKALALYKKILNINPADNGALLALAELNEAKGLVNDAVSLYLAAADSLARGGEKEKYFGICQKIVSLSPSNIPLRTKLADLHLKEGRTSEALKEYFSIAQLSAEDGDTEQAISFYRKILGLEQSNRQALLELSSVYEKIGDSERAIAVIKESMHVLPGDTEVLLKASEVYGSAGKFDEARDYLEQVTASEPANLRARKMLGDLYVKEGNRHRAWDEYLPVLDDILLEENHEKAIRMLESFRDIDPVETGKRLVTLFMQRGEHQSVVQQLQALGDIFLRDGKQREALNYYREAFKILPGDEVLKDKVIELEKDLGKEHIAIEEEKSLEEALIEADIYIRYGLTDKALESLETFRQTEPENVDLRLKLKQIYTELGNTSEAVAECLALHRLYEESGDTINSTQMIRDAFVIDREDPRLAEFASLDSADQGEAGAVPQEATIDDYDEEIAEADFYARQGLTDEARKILERLHTLFPENMEVNQKLSALQQVAEETAAAEAEMPAQRQESQSPGAEPHVGAGSTPVEPSSEGNVMAIFDEFKKGLEKEIEAEDYETHYNLAIAYKEMGLLDDAIREFQVALNDPKRFVHSSNMLGICYAEKGLYQLAIDVFKNSLARIKERDEAYWTMMYDLAEVYEKEKNIEEALDAYQQVYGWDPQFRETSEKVNTLKAAVRKSSDQQKLKERKDRVSYL